MGLYAMEWAFHAPIQSSGAKFILVALAEHARDEGREGWTCFPSVKRLAKWTAQGERTIERHLSWLIAEGWISRETRHGRRRGESAYFYTLHRVNAEADDEPSAALSHDEPAKMAANRSAIARQIGAEHPPIPTPTPARLAPAYIEEPVIEPVSESDALQARDIEDRFAEFWSAYPNQIEERGAKGAFKRLVRDGDATPDQLIDGARSYAEQVRDRASRYIKTPTNWLRMGCWMDTLAAAGTPVSAKAAAVFEGPDEVWATVTRRKGLGWAVSYLAPCAWSPSSRTLRARTAFAARTLREELGALLRDLAVAIIEPTTTFGDAHAY
jgi:hypothetical protein